MLGDEYYRCVSTASRSAEDMHKCIELGRNYLQALESLRAHLKKLGDSPEVRSMLQATKSHIALVKKELRSFDKCGRSGH